MKELGLDGSSLAGLASGPAGTSLFGKAEAADSAEIAADHLKDGVGSADAKLAKSDSGIGSTDAQQ